MVGFGRQIELLFVPVGCVRAVSVSVSATATTIDLFKYNKIGITNGGSTKPICIESSSKDRLSFSAHCCPVVVFSAIMHRMSAGWLLRHTSSRTRS